MAVSLPYLSSNKNLEKLFSSVEAAKVPDRFTQEFLVKTIALASTNDRALISLLRTLGFLDQSGAPTEEYRRLKNKQSAKAAIAAAIRRAYKPLFEANETANELPSDRLKGLVAQVAGTDSDMTARITSTFNSLVRLGDFSASPEPGSTDDSGDEEEIPVVGPPKGDGRRQPAFATQFHYNIQIHLPSNGAEAVYLNIFNALRKVFQ